MLLDVETGRHVRSFTCSGQVTSVTLTPGQPRLLTAGLDNNVQLWDADSGKLLWQQRQEAGYGPPVAASPDGKRVAVANATTLDGEVVVRDAASGEALHTILADDLG
ncbi:MAG: PQQ-binding-like beta-propeller repeat protein [Gemmataceae bacterium]